MPRAAASASVPAPLPVEMQKERAAMRVAAAAAAAAGGEVHAAPLRSFISMHHYHRARQRRREALPHSKRDPSMSHRRSATLRRSSRCPRTRPNPLQLRKKSQREAALLWRPAVYRSPCAPRGETRDSCKPKTQRRALRRARNEGRACADRPPVVPPTGGYQLPRKPVDTDAWRDDRRKANHRQR